MANTKITAANIDSTSTGITFADLTVNGDITGTLATAAQPNITSVGTLTGFTSTGIDDNATSTAITIDSNENLGIGTASPVNNGTGSQGLTINGTGNYQNLNLQVNNTTQFTIYTNGTSGTFINQVTADPMMFYTSDTERMRINATGGLSINDNVENPLSLNRTTTTTGASYMRFTNGGGNYYIGADSSAGDRMAIGGQEYGFTMTAESGRPLVFATSNIARMAIDSSGNVGIGTSSVNANAKLHVEGAGDSQILIYETGTSPYTATLKLASQSTTAYGANVQYTSGAEQLTIENFGRALSPASSSGGIRFRTKVGNSSMTEVLSINGNTGQVIQPVQYYTTTYRGANQSVGAVTWTNWTFNSDLDYTGTNMRSADGVITFPIAGLYLVTGLLSVGPVTATNYNQFRAAFGGTANNSPISLGINEVVSGNDFGYDIPISFMVKIANTGTDLMYIQAFSGSGSLTLRGGTSSSHLNVRLLG